MSDLTTAVDWSAEAESAERTVGEALAQELVERARSEGVELVGLGGLLSGLTKTVLESALEAELDEHLGYPSTRSRGATRATRATGSGRRRC